MCMEDVEPSADAADATDATGADCHSAVPVDEIALSGLSNRQKNVICEQATEALTKCVLMMHEQMLEDLPIETLAKRFKIQAPTEEKEYVLTQEEFATFAPAGKKWKAHMRDVLAHDENIDVCKLDEADEQKLQGAIDHLADVMYDLVKQLIQVVVEQLIVFQFVSDETIRSALSIRHESILKRICLKVIPQWLEESIFTFAKLKADDDSADSDDESSLPVSQNSSDDDAGSNSDTSEELDSEDSDDESSNDESPHKKPKIESP